MTPEQFRKAAKRLYGDERGWQTKMAADLGVDSASVSRWLSGTVTIPGPVAAAVECWLSRTK